MLERIANGKLTQWLAPSMRAGWSMFETLLLTAAAVGIGLWLRPADPMALGAEFHWILLVPVVVALRYGGLVGVWAMLCLIGCWFALQSYGVYSQQAFPEGAMLGGLVLTLIAGEFSDLWRTRLMRADSSASYSLERLKNLTQRFVLLRLSHDRLEENLLTKPYTVRDALLRLRGLTLEESREISLPAGDDLLGILADYCQLQRAALYACWDDVIHETPAALLGENKPLEKNNALLAHAMENRLLAHVQQEREEHYHGAYLVAAPVSNSAGDIIGVLVVERMPFLSVNHENLQLLSVLLNFYADVVYAGKEAQSLLQQWPELPFQMAREMVALSRLREEGKVETSLTLFVADDSEQAGLILDALGRGLRSLDLAWWVSDRTLLIMMPMTGVSGLEGFVLRTEKWLQEEFAFMSLRQAGVRFFYRHMDTRAPEVQLGELLEAGRV